MTLAVTSLGKTLESPIDQRFGRARFFVVVDLETDQWYAEDNTQNLEAAEGAGIQAAQFVANLGVKGVITGHCGPNAFATLTSADIEVYPDATGTVRDAVNAYNEGLLKRSMNADVEAGHGAR